MAVLTPATNIDPSPAVGGGDIMLVGGSALLAQEGPAGTAADIENQPTSAQISVYMVRAGDTLSGIAAMFDVTTNTIVWANDIKGGAIRPGDTLIILPITGIQHTVLRGETLTSLASTYKSNAHEIAQYNGLADGVALSVGVVVLIPNGEISVASTASQTKSTVTGARAKVIKSIAKGTKTEPYLGGSGAVLNGYYAWPVMGGVITQGLHGWNAVDIGAPRGTSILAAAPGIVIIARDNGGWNGGYGNYIVIQHLNGTQTLYAHASKILVTAGTSVAQGQTIAKVGNTGESTGNHVHFEVRGAANPFQ
ncbi:MAG: peptidoglycan DD-metalloendopeptidase family protein [bacterium]|nr:peptidoglycan DD-metalloendopeptidase family protein [bacterium]